MAPTDEELATWRALQPLLYAACDSRGSQSIEDRAMVVGTMLIPLGIDPLLGQQEQEERDERRRAVGARFIQCAREALQELRDELQLPLTRPDPCAEAILAWHRFATTMRSLKDSGEGLFEGKDPEITGYRWSTPAQTVRERMWSGNARGSAESWPAIARITSAVLAKFPEYDIEAIRSDQLARQEALQDCRLMEAEFSMQPFHHLLRTRAFRVVHSAIDGWSVRCDDMISSLHGITTMPRSFEARALNLGTTAGEVALPEHDLWIDLDLSCLGAEIARWPKHVCVCGNAQLAGCTGASLQSVATMFVGGSLGMRFSGLSALPQRLTVAGSLDLRDTTVTSLPDALRVGGRILYDQSSLVASSIEEYLRKREQEPDYLGRLFYVQPTTFVEDVDRMAEQ